MCMNTNTRGLLTAAQLICPKMEKNGEGVVAVTGATASWRGKPFTAAFAAAKSAQRILSQSLGMYELKGPYSCLNLSKLSQILDKSF